MSYRNTYWISRHIILFLRLAKTVAFLYHIKHFQFDFNHVFFCKISTLIDEFAVKLSKELKSLQASLWSKFVLFWFFWKAPHDTANLHKSRYTEIARGVYFGFRDTSPFCLDDLLINDKLSKNVIRKYFFKGSRDN